MAALRPFDRLLAASALRRGVAIVSADPVFDAVVARILVKRQLEAARNRKRAASELDQPINKSPNNCQLAPSKLASCIWRIGL